MLSRTIRILASMLTLSALLLAGCGAAKVAPTTAEGLKLQPQLQAALVEVKEMDENAQKGDWTTSRHHFDEFVEKYGDLKEKINAANPKLIAKFDHAIDEVTAEFKKDVPRKSEMSEEDGVISDLLQQAANALGAGKLEAKQVESKVELAPHTSEQTIDVTLSEYKIEPAVITVKKDAKVTFNLKNTGTEIHEFEIEGYDAEKENIQPGTTAQLVTVTNKTGEFELACHLPGHAEQGMKAKLVVTDK